jgi:hypothetical protein
MLTAKLLIKRTSKFTLHILSPVSNNRYCISNMLSTKTFAVITGLLSATILVGSLLNESFIANAALGPRASDRFLDKFDRDKPSEHTRPGGSTGIDVATGVQVHDRPSPEQPPLQQKIASFMAKENPPNLELSSKLSSKLYDSNSSNSGALIDFVRPFANFLFGLIQTIRQ